MNRRTDLLAILVGFVSVSCGATKRERPSAEARATTLASASAAVANTLAVVAAPKLLAEWRTRAGHQAQ